MWLRLRIPLGHLVQTSQPLRCVNRHSTVTHYQRPNMTHLQEGGTGEEVSEILFFSAKSKRRPSLIYSMQIIPVCLSIVARRKGVSATRRGGSNWTPISLLVGHPCKLFHTPLPGNRIETRVIVVSRINRRTRIGRLLRHSWRSAHWHIAVSSIVMMVSVHLEQKAYPFCPDSSVFPQNVVANKAMNTRC